MVELLNRSLSILILWWIILSAIDSSFVYYVTSLEERDGAWGGSIQDLLYISLVRFSACLFCISFFYVARHRSSKCREELIAAIFWSMLCTGYWAYILTKCLNRLVEDQEWGLNSNWYWAAIVVTCFACSLETIWALQFLQTTLELRIEMRHDDYMRMEDGNQKIVSKNLWGTAFDWIHGKIKQASEEDAEDDEDEKLLETDETKENSASFGKLIHMSKPDIPLLTLASAALFVAAIGQTIIPKLTGEMISAVSHYNRTYPEEMEQSMNDLRSCTGKLLIAAAVTSIFTATRGSLFTIAMSRLNIRVRTTLLEALLQQEIGFFDVTKAGKLASRLNSDTTTLSDQISLNLNVFLRSFVQAIGVMFFMFKLNVDLSLATFVTVPAVALITRVYGKVLQKLYKETQKRLANANAVSDAALTTMHTVRCFASEASELERYKHKMAIFYELSVRQAVVYSVYAVIFTLLPCLSTALVLYYGGTLVLNGELKSGDLVSFMLYQQSLSDAINSIGGIFSGIAGALGAADKVFELIDREPKEVPKGDDKPDEFRGQIEFKNIVFRYPARPDSVVLEDFNLKIGQGQTVALVGPSGGGKSSVIKLLERLYDPESGLITLSGHPLNSYDHHYLHQMIAIVGQEPILYARTIAQNIIYGLEGDSEPKMDEIIASAKASNAHDFILTFPDGYNTKCGERGIQLSGGQKQRISIARALIRKPKVLLLDEATSALDAESEAVVQGALDKIMASGNHTCIVVAHRLSTVRNADAIAVIKDGNIKELGTHDQLISKKDSIYHALVEKQVKAAD